jgi:hypothetical protein
LVWLKKFGPAQNILGPVKGQGISKCRIDGEDFVSFCGLLRKHELYTQKGPK